MQFFHLSQWIFNCYSDKCGFPIFIKVISHFPTVNAEFSPKHLSSRKEEEDGDDDGGGGGGDYDDDDDDE